ncbi:MAG TPA: arylamine N-acetyltransferase [Candidatus Tectomicrobia bacterium]
MAFDLDAYCTRIGYTGSREVSPATLHGLHLAHTHTVPFENLDIHLGHPLSLDAPDLFAKIVSRKRGGYCYEVNSCFALLLQALGFQVQGLLARVLDGFATLRPRSHQLLVVTVEDESWIADVGFGRNSLRAPLRLTPDVVDQQGPDTFCLRSEAGQVFCLQKVREGHWHDLYAFTLEPYLPVDYVPLNYWNSTSPDSLFTQKKICTMPTITGRIVAVDTEFTIHTHEITHTIQARSPTEYIQLLQEYFGLEIEGTFIR